MPLKVLCAGCSKEERQWAETTVRQAVGGHADYGVWSVSMVRIADKWSLTIDAPSQGLRGQTLVAPTTGLREAITGALPGASARHAAPAAAPRAAPAPPAPAGEARLAHRCDTCRKDFVVVYQAAPGEGQEVVSVACPHCWAVTRLMIGERAALDRDYRADRV
jgi:hypothetical protein